jgi:hypothetical protein
MRRATFTISRRTLACLCVMSLLNAGAIDEVGIFNVILAEEDILDIMDNGLEATGLLPVSPSGKLTSTWGFIKSRK